MKPIKIFLAEDDSLFGEPLRYHLQLNPDYEVHLFQTGKDFLSNFYQKPDTIPTIAVLSWDNFPRNFARFFWQLFS